MNVSEAIRTRRVVRQFLEQPLSEDDVYAILNAGRRAPSSKNRQEWQFIAIRERETLRALAACGEWAGHLAGAALGVAISHPTPAARFQTMFDAGQAAAYMLAGGLGAWDRLVSGLHLRTEAGARPSGLPPEWHYGIALSFGYPAEAAILTAAPRTKADAAPWKTWCIGSGGNVWGG